MDESLMSREISVGQVASEEDVMKVPDYLRNLMNDTCEKRAIVTPILKRKGEIKSKGYS